MSKHRSCVCNKPNKKPRTINKQLIFLCEDCIKIKPKKNGKRNNI